MNDSPHHELAQHTHAHPTEDLALILGDPNLPESDAWQALCDAAAKRDRERSLQALEAIAQSVSRRLAGQALPRTDLTPDDGRRAPSPALARSWEELKKAIVFNELGALRARLAALRTGVNELGL